MTYVIVSGILFGVMDGLINANPFTPKLFEIYKPVAIIWWDDSLEQYLVEEGNISVKLPKR